MRRPGYALTVISGFAIIGLLVTRIPHGGAAVDSPTGPGVVFLASVLLLPLLSCRSFHLATGTADSQWVLTAPGGATAVLIEHAGVRLALTFIAAGWGLLYAAAVGKGRPFGSATLFLLVAAVTSLANTSFSSLSFKAISPRTRPLLTQISAGALLILGLGAIASNFLGLRALAAPAGYLIEGRLNSQSALMLVALTSAATASFALKIRSSSWYVEPMIAAGLKRERESANLGTLKTTHSWEGPKSLQGPAGAFLYTQLVYLRRLRTRTFITAGILGTIATLVTQLLDAQPVLSFVPVFALALAFRLAPVPALPWRDEWFARSPDSLRGALVMSQARHSIETTINTTASWAPVALVWNHGPLLYALVGTSALLTLLLLNTSRNYASLIQVEQPTTSLLIRLALPAAIAVLGGVVWLLTGHSTPLLAAFFATLSTVALVAVLELSIKAINPRSIEPIRAT